ncbi:MAG: hypothetical protein EAZ92_04680 [Candidatus Kapaibacterium sp.]|nr:MAG: hypothetical protein EAZ92_04680 [Candidatus Kapabacteria bacterium]
MKTFFTNLGSAVALAALMFACAPTPPTPPADFIAGDSNLVNVASSWTRIVGPLVGTAGADGSFLGAAHRVTDTTAHRTVYSRNNFVSITKNATSGRYPIGTMLVKLIRRRTDSTVIGGAMMVKRGGDFAAANATGWEWINLSASGQVASRFRSDSAAAACVGCHRTRMSNDYSFSLK